MEKILLSLIIPVYNVEQYMRKCLDSVLRQGLDSAEYEVILVNDGSRDNSLQICEEYKAKYSNFKIVNQLNQGVAAARNNGIEHSSGRFVGFLDSDDYLLDNGIKLAFLPFAERDDIDVIHFFSSYDNWEIKPINNEIDFDGSCYDYIMKMGLPSFCWLFFYKKEFLDSHGIRFENYVVGEDQLFSSWVYIANPRILSTKANIYRYVIRNESATTRRSVEHTRKCVNDYLCSYMNIMNLLEKYKIAEIPLLYNKCIDSLNSKKIFGVSRILSANYSFSEYYKIKKTCTDSKFYPVKVFSKGLKNRIMVHLLNLTIQNVIFYKLSNIIFNRILVPYIMPVIRKKL
jgi:glycosyltransferase involved in cell wall biosynthesis